MNVKGLNVERTRAKKMFSSRRGATLLCLVVVVVSVFQEWAARSSAQDAPAPQDVSPDGVAPPDVTPVADVQEGADGEMAGRAPELIVFSGAEFDGRSLGVRGSLLDLPKEEGPDGAIFDWNDRIRSIIVVRGTWRLYENGRRNTELDETPLESLDLTQKASVGGWSCVVSARGDSPASLSFRDGLFAKDDISSIELLTDRPLPEVRASPRGERVPEIEVFWDIDFEGRSLIIRDSVADLSTIAAEIGGELDWDDNISSIVVRGGTWRLCENAGFNAEGGWSVHISSRGGGEIRQSASECGGWTNDDISSIQLVSDGVLEDWAILNRAAGRRS